MAGLASVEAHLESLREQVRHQASASESGSPAPSPTRTPPESVQGGAPGPGGPSAAPLPLPSHNPPDPGTPAPESNPAAPPTGDGRRGHSRSAWGQGGGSPPAAPGRGGPRRESGGEALFRRRLESLRSDGALVSDVFPIPFRRGPPPARRAGLGEPPHWGASD